MRAPFSFFFCLGLLALSVPAAADLFVAATGADQNPGSAAKPFATLGRALAAAADGADKRIVVLPGRYALAHGLVLDARHRGVSIHGEPGAVLTGSVAVPSSATTEVDADLARRLPPQAGAHVRQIAVNRLGLSGADFQRPRGFTVTSDAPSELFVGGRAQELARWPNEGMVPIYEVIDAGQGQGTGTAPVIRVDSSRPATWGPGDVWAYGYWKWDWADEGIPVESIREATLTLKAAHHYGIAKGQPIRFENVIEELDRPGECAIVGNRLVFWPSSEHGRIEISRVGEPLLTLDNGSNVQIEGLTFENSRGRALELRESEVVAIDRCTFQGLGGNAATATGCRNVRFLACKVEETGEGGFFLDCGDRATLSPSHVVVLDCSFRRFMRRVRTYRPAVRLNGVGITVGNCDFRDAPHSAILFGGNDHLIEHNRFVDLLSDTGDGGAVYGGRDWTARGTVIRENLFARIRGMRKWENAVYLDDQFSGTLVERNVFVECHWAMLIGGGRENVVRDNLLLGCTLGFSTDARGLGWAASTLATLKERLAAVPATQEPWRKRYPDLVDILNNQPMAPMRNVLEGNVLVRSGRITDRLDPTFDRLGTVKDNPSLTLAGWRLTSGGFALDPALQKALAEWPKVAGLQRQSYGPGH
ncbi:MAG: right-handed parallel beta-helix repeat-containing protein [Fimbriimonadaceae bacterium]|nr:right-handed parallel beta-helix repeat-containing protein [Fimbriimonadaceae bacterium]